MKVFSLTILLLTAALGFNNVIAQKLETGVSVKRPDFSGKWRLRPSQSSDPNPLIPKVFGIVMKIEQKLPSVRFVLSAVTPAIATDAQPELTFTLYADGRGDTYEPGIVKETSTTAWRDNKLVVTFRNKENIVTGHQQYELMPNGRVLKITWLGSNGLATDRRENAEWLDKID